MIFYFSATGNSKFTADKLAVAQNEKTVSVTDCLRNKKFDFELTDNEKIGFVFPVYFYGIPTVVESFVKQLRLRNVKSQYTFAVCTCGGTSAFTLNVFGKLLKRQGLNLNFGCTVLMPDNYIILFNLATSEEKVKIILVEAEKNIAAANACVSNCSTGISRQFKGFLPWLMTFFCYPIYKLGRSTGPFYATDKCTGCGLCEKICPCSMIYLEDSHVGWKEGKCAQCLGCLHRCPVSCIEYGRKTRGRKRYVNPDINK